MMHKLKHPVMRLTDPKQPQFALACDFISISNLQLLLSDKLICHEISQVRAQKDRTLIQVFQKLVCMAVKEEKWSYEILFVLSKSQKSGQSINSVSSQFIPFQQQNKVLIHSSSQNIHLSLVVVCSFFLLGDTVALLIQQGLEVQVSGGTEEREQNHNCVTSNVTLRRWS